ncbi:hypothetical protein Si098_01259 [Streptococcus infantarius subsp. infantarius]|nr:hypothetical protein [Streptococcus infantarius subsp. infantarius]
MTPIAKLTQNMVVVDLMNQTGWNRDRVVAAIEELERAKLVCFNSQGNLQLRIGAEVL